MQLLISNSRILDFPFDMDSDVASLSLRRVAQIEVPTILAFVLLRN